jgi:DnaJ homolog subfamily C member 19
MIVVLLGAASLVVLMWALGAFSRAQVATLKQLGIWIAAIGGLLLAVLLLLTGRLAAALPVLIFLGPMVWSWIAQGKRPQVRPGGGRAAPPPRGGGPMSRAEAYQVLGLQPGASEVDIRAAHRRLMLGAHPDHGGSDWLAARINQARDVLLG